MNLRTLISFKPENAPQEVPFYRLPLDSNGFKEDRTYLVIGGFEDLVLKLPDGCAWSKRLALAFSSDSRTLRCVKI